MLGKDTCNTRLISFMNEVELAVCYGRKHRGGSRGGSLGSDEPPFGSRQ